MSEMHGAPTLVILAAGLGSRYGDSKQIAGVGPDGEWLLEYAVHDALAAGFTQIVMVSRPVLRAALATRLTPHLQGRAALHFVEQSPDKIPAGCRVPTNRSKPLGTGHALWCCAPLLRGPFAVINADDYYGRAAFALLARHFRGSQTPAMVGYRLSETVSPNGDVNRGICRLDAADRLVDIAEYTRIGIRGGGLRGTDPDDRERDLPSDTIVSLNCWGLTPELLPDLESGLREFLAHAGAKDEYFLPHAIARHLALRGHELMVLRGDGEWLGLTYPGDRAHVTARLAALHAAGEYPTPLWTPA